MNVTHLLYLVIFQQGQLKTEMYWPAGQMDFNFFATLIIELLCLSGIKLFDTYTLVRISKIISDL